MTRKCGILKGFWGPKMGKFYTTFLLRLEIRFFRKITKMCDLLWFLRQLKCRNFWRKMCVFFERGCGQYCIKIAKNTIIILLKMAFELEKNATWVGLGLVGFGLG